MSRAIANPALLRGLLCAWLACCFGITALAAEVSVAVAANFTAPMKVIAQDFERDTGHRASLAFGATGQFYAQIRNGAPYAAFLAADDNAPQKLEAEGFGVAGSRFTYATGRLVLWSKKPGFVDPQGDVLRGVHFDRIAISNPKLAPYGAAAVEVLIKMGLHDRILAKAVEGSNITQTFQFVASGNADLGFVALAQVFENGRITQGSGWVVPAALHTPIRQEAVLLNPGKGNAAALALLKYLQTPKARATILSFGYEL
jgi:molybdate transport system substrate-binding protein